MTKRAPILQRKAVAGDGVRLELADLKQDASGWLFTGNMAGWSKRTLTERGWWMTRLAEYLEAGGHDFTRAGVCAWLLALQDGTEHRCRGPLKPGSLATAQRVLRAFDAWRLREGLATEGAMDRVPSVIVRDDQVHPFDDSEVRKLLEAAKTSACGKRDAAIVLLLLDTGLRATELCDLRYSDLDLTAGMVTVRSGKGGKRRVVPVSRGCATALYTYLRAERRALDDPLFITQRGEAMQRNTLRLLCDRLQRRTGIHCHAHRFRHTTACAMLRNGAHAPSVQAMLGHTRLAATERYVTVTAADLANVHRSASPVTNLLKARKGVG